MSTDKKSVYKTLKDIPLHNKIGLGLGFTSLGLGLTNFGTNQNRAAEAKKEVELQAKSLTALQKIHSALNKLNKPHTGTE